MGRWGDGIYQSDAALDFFVKISDSIEREIAFWMSPEQIQHHASWLGRVLTVIEIILLFDKNQIGTTSYLHSWEKESPVTRWESEFFKVWDGDWNSDKESHLPYSQYNWRIQNRHIAKMGFQRIKSLVDYWSDDLELAPFPSEIDTPYFSSVSTWTERKFVSDLTTEFIDTIFYVLADETRKLAIGIFLIEDVWVAVDILGTLGEAYHFSPIDINIVYIWQNKTIELWKARLSEENIPWDDNDLFYNNVLEVFKRLKLCTNYV